MSIDRHPLEPLSAAEIQQAVSVLRTSGKLTATTRVVSIMLKEPPKETVNVQADGGHPRQADAVLFDNGTNS